MLYDVVLVWPPHATLLYSVVLERAQEEQFFATFLRKFSLQTSSVTFLQSSPLTVLSLLFLTCVRLLVLQSFKMDSGDE